MSRHRTFAVAFAATVAAIVPAAWHGLDATIDRDGKHVRPLQHEIVIDGARVTIDVDRSVITTGDNVVAKLRAFSDTPKRVAVDLTVLRSDDTFGSRVAGPPVAIDKEHIVLDAEPDGGKVVDTRLTMPSSGGGEKLDSFAIFVGKRGAELNVFENDGESAESAAIGVLGWTQNDFAMTITPKGKLTRGQPFEVTVRLENTSGHKQKHAPYINLGTSVNLYGIQNNEEDFKIEETGDDSDDDSAPPYNKSWKPGAVVTRTFTVTPQRDDLDRVNLLASAFLWGEDMSPVAAGSLDVRSFKLAPAAKPEAPTPAVAAQ